MSETPQWPTLIKEMSITGIYQIIAEIKKRPDVASCILTTEKQMGELLDDMQREHFIALAERIADEPA